MPEFILDTAGTVEGVRVPTFEDLAAGRGDALAWHDLDPFTQGYIEALFFTESSPAWSRAEIEADPDGWRKAEEEGTSDGTLPGDSGFADLAPEALASIIADCAAFQVSEAFKAFADWRAGCDGDEASDIQAGRDFWFTRNGHGVGFWDRPVTYYGVHRDDLTETAKAFGEATPYLGDDGRVYL